MTRFSRPFKQYFRRDGDNGDNVQWNSITQASIKIIQHQIGFEPRLENVRK